MIPTLEVVSIEAKNVCGISRMKMQPKKITRIVGRNASGKSSACRVITSIFGGGSLANLARIENGVPTEPEIVLLMGEPGQPYQYKAIKNRKGITVKERVEGSQAFKDVLRPQEFLDGLYDQAGANPVKFLNAIEAANPKEFVRLVLEALPIKRPGDQLAEILGEDIEHVTGREGLLKLHPIEEIEATIKALYVTREGFGRNKRNAQQAAERLKRMIPAIVEVKAVREELDTVDKEAREMREKVTAARAQVEAQYNADNTAAVTAFDTAKAAAEAAFNAAMKAADAALNESIGAAKTALQEARNEAFVARDETTAQEIYPMAAILEAKDDRVQELKHALEQAAKDETLSNEAALAEQDEARFKAGEDRLTGKMAQLEALKASLGENLPIKGLEITPEQILLDGIPAKSANTGRKVRLAVQLSTLRQDGTTLPFIVVDGAENLDTEVFEALCDELASIPKLQAFLARVDDCAITVESDGSPAGLVEVGSEEPAMATA